jgi:6-phosphogluconolactonase
LQIDGSPFTSGQIPIGIAADPAGDFLLVTNGGSNDVSVFHIDQASGALSPVSNSPFPTGEMPCGIAIDRSGQFVYIGNWDSHDLSGYRLERPTGRLLPL